MIWFIDFDDTLAVGPNTWALEYVLPQMIKDNQLPYDPERYERVLLQAQQQSNEALDERIILDEMFGQLGWPDHLKQQLVKQVFNDYTPELFDDTKPFLERLTAAGHTLYILSNNTHAPQIAEGLGISSYFADIFTPDTCGGVPGKPRRDMWDCITSRYSLPDLATVNILGDDPWSDGTFAEHCGAHCWIIDRMQRYSSLHEQKSYRWVSSLGDVP